MNPKIPYPIPSNEVSAEIRVVNSRFIASLAPAENVEEAKAFIARIKTEFSDATHHVPVFLIGHGDSVTAHCSDDGEPSGTAGRPALAVLQGSGLGDVVMVITRYFGGTKLGTGGLVRAYSDSVRSVLEKVERSARVMTDTVQVSFPYTYLERIRRIAAAGNAVILHEDFDAEVTFIARFQVEETPGFKSQVINLTSGSVIPEIIDTSEVLVPWKSIK
ncbi:MAG TPA: YigZ family protein [Leptolinea sp.]